MTAFCAISLALPFCAQAQDAVPQPTAQAQSNQEPGGGTKQDFSGTVRTRRGLAVPGATIRLVNATSGKVWETFTDEQGQFSLSDLPSGHYRIEAQQIGLGSAAWDSESEPGVAQSSTTQRTIDLILHRPNSDETATPAEVSSASSENKNAVAPSESDTSTATTEPPKKHHKAASTSDSQNAETNAPAGPNDGGTSSESSKIQSTNANSTKSSKAAKPGADTSKPTKSKKGGFEQVETTGTLTASADSAQNPTPAQLSGGATTQSSDAYLINGAIGHGSTAEGLDANDQEDGSAGDNASDNSSSGAAKKPKHQNSNGHTHKSNSFATPADNLTGSVADLTVRNTIKHLGSNQIHATFYNYYDTSAWDARPYAINGGPADKIAHFSERFGVNLGGPLAIPKLYNGKDRTFWFVNYELNRHTSPVNLFANMPTASERTGNFCDRGVQLYDPLSNLAGPRQSFGCAIPSSRLDPAALKLIALMPLPNLPGFNLNYVRSTRSPQSVDLVNFRILQSISSRFSVSGVFNLVSARGTLVTDFPPLNGNVDTRDQNITLTFTQNWTPRLTNETKINFNRSRNQVFSTNAFNNNVAAQDGVMGVSQAPIDFGAPDIVFANFEELADPTPQLVRNQTLRFIDNISYTLSKHTFQAGG